MTKPMAARTIDQSATRPSMIGASLFVTTVFMGLAACFVASTWYLWSEFQDHGWASLAIAHSHLFIFFPTFGVLALVAFHLPSVVFTHLYWHHLRYGKARFLFGLLVALVLTAIVSLFMLGPTTSPRAIWEVAPRTLQNDRGEPAACMGSKTVACRRVPLLGALQSLRDKSQARSGLSRFARLCVPDPLLEPPEANSKQRWCFPSDRMADATECCAAQRAFMTTLAEQVSRRETRSSLADREYPLQAAKIFFILVVLVIGGMLVLWRDAVEQHYPHLARRIERNVMVGGLAMLLWPVMDYAYLDVSDVLFGRWSDDLQWRLSIVVAPWSLLLLFYFLRRFARKVEVFGQIAGIGGGLAALLVRDELKDWAVRYVGVGMPSWMMVVLAGLLVAGFVALLLPVRDRPLTPDAE